MLILILNKITRIVVPRLDSALIRLMHPACTGPHPTCLCSPSKMIQFIGLLQIGMQRKWSYLDTRKNSGDLTGQANSGCSAVSYARDGISAYHRSISSLTRKRLDADAVESTNCIFMPRWWTDYAWPARVLSVKRM